MARVGKRRSQTLILLPSSLTAIRGIEPLRLLGADSLHVYEVHLRAHEGKYSVGVSLDSLKNGLPAASNTESMPYLPREEETLEQSLVYYDAYVANILKSAKSKGWTLMDRAEKGGDDSG